MKRLFSLIIILAFLISCGNSLTDFNNKKDNQLKIITEGTKLVNYGLKSSFVNITNNSELESLWKGMTTNKNIYSSSSSTFPSGRFDANADYYEDKWEAGKKARAVFKKCYVYMFENKAYLSAVYWDNKTGVGMRIRYRLLIINDKGEEHAWYGGGGDINILPNENTEWVKYDFLFGYLKDY